MISSVKFTQNREAVVAVEHPDEWDEKQLKAAVIARLADVTNAAPWYDNPSRTKLAGLVLDEDPTPEPEEEDGDMKPYRPKPLELTEEDLADGEAMLEDEEEEPAEEPAEKAATTTEENGDE